MPLLQTGKSWSRAVTAEPISGEGPACSEISFSDDSSACTTGECASRSTLAISKREFHELLAASVRGMVFAVTISALSEEDASHDIHAVSKGVEDLYGWHRSDLIGDSERLLESYVSKSTVETEAKLRMAHLHGAEAVVVQTQRKASGEVFKVCRYKRGMSFGTDPITGEDMWYLLTVTFDVSSELGREQHGDRCVDYDFYQESAVSIAAQVKSKISAAISGHLSDRAMWGDEAKCGAQQSDIDADDQDVKPLHVSVPGWVACPPASKMLLTGI